MMKKILTTLVFVAGLATFASAQGDYVNKTIKPGQKAPELSYPTPAGKILKLSEVNKGHIVMIDFWASWCGPCRRSNPALVALYNKYKDAKFKGAKKGFAIYSVSLDQKKDAWIKAIADDKLVWANHVSDLGGWQSEAAVAYGVQFIPQAFLVGADGKVIGAYQNSEQAGEALAALAGK